MNPLLEEKLNRIMELKGQLDEITSELESLLGMGEKSNFIKRLTGKKSAGSLMGTGVGRAMKWSGRKCGYCGKPGHRRDSCTGENAVAPRSESTVKKTTGEKLEGAMSEDEFLDVKDRQEAEETSGRVASDMLISLREVNLAFNSKTYDDYIERR